MKNPCEARKIKASQILHKIISTHYLTVLTIRAILRIEQKKRNTHIEQVKTGGMRYVDAQYFWRRFI